MTTKEMIEILQAYEMGEKIEWRKKNSDMRFVILNDKNHDFDFEHFEYRIKRWRAKKGEKYYYINSSGEVSEETEVFYWCDKERYLIGNYFRTEELAKKARELLKETLKKFNEENEF